MPRARARGPRRERAGLEAAVAPRAAYSLRVRASENRGRRRRTPRRWACAVAAAVLGAAGATAAARPQADKSGVVVGDLGRRIDEHLARSVPFGFAGSVLVEKDGKVLVKKGYGDADRELGIPNDARTLFDIGSLTKQITAVAVLRLEREGKLKIDDPIARYLERVPPDKSAITIHHLLTHTSGLPRALRTVGENTEDRAEMLAAVLAAPLESAFGRRHSYSNVAYDLLAAVVELAAKEPFDSVVRRTCFVPAGMTRSGFCEEPELEKAASARAYRDDVAKTLAVDDWYSWGMRGAGGVVTSVDDLHRWELALRGGDLLDEAAKKKLFQPFLDDYALGWRVGKTPKRKRVIEHGGTTNSGFDVHYARYVEDGATVIVLSNVAGGSLPARVHVGRLLLGLPTQSPPEAAPFDESLAAQVAGTYSSDPETTLVASVERGHLVLEARGQGAMDLVAARPGAGSSAFDSVAPRAAAVVKALQSGKLAEVHAMEDPRNPLFFLDDWWPRLAEKNGPLKSCVFLGTAPDPEGDAQSCVRVEFERKVDLLRLRWSQGKLVGLNLGPPHVCCLRLVPLKDGSFARCDLLTSTVRARARFRFDARGAPTALEMEVGGRKHSLARRAP